MIYNNWFQKYIIANFGQSVANTINSFPKLVIALKWAAKHNTRIQFIDDPSRMGTVMHYEKASVIYLSTRGVEDPLEYIPVLAHELYHLKSDLLGGQAKALINNRLLGHNLYSEYKAYEIELYYWRKLFPDKSLPCRGKLNLLRANNWSSFKSIIKRCIFIHDKNYTEMYKEQITQINKKFRHDSVFVFPKKDYIKMQKVLDKQPKKFLVSIT